MWYVLSSYPLLLTFEMAILVSWHSLYLKNLYDQVRVHVLLCNVL